MSTQEEFADSGMISAVTGGPVEGLLYDPKRKRNSWISAVTFYFFLAIFIWLGSLVAPKVVTPTEVQLPNLVFIAEPGPGGGGGGGGENSPDPASIQKVEGQDQARLALQVEEPEEELVFEEEEPVEPEEEPEPEEPEEEDELNDIKAPVVAQAPDDFDQKGILEGPEQLLDSAGSGNGGGSGTGMGAGIGEGDGPGIGPGYGGGFGGGCLPDRQWRRASRATTPSAPRVHRSCPLEEDPRHGASRDHHLEGRNGRACESASKSGARPGSKSCRSRSAVPLRSRQTPRRARRCDSRDRSRLLSALAEIPLSKIQ